MLKVTLPWLAIVVLALPAASQTPEKVRINATTGHTYVQLTPSNWFDAEAMAVALGGHLVTINDQPEQNWIRNKFQVCGVPLWIGFTDAANEGSFVWVSGEPVTYTGWSINEPNNFNGNEDQAIQDWGGGWNDFNGLLGTGGAFPCSGSPIRGLVELEASTVSTYCTAGTSASGCQAVLSATGTASSTLPSGFVVAASGVEGDKDGLFFFGLTGRQASPWGNGTSYQCVVPPVYRAGLQLGNGTLGACDGLTQRDLNALWTAIPPKNPGAGALVQAQFWFRDPLNTSNQTTSLSDAIEFTVTL